MPTTHADPMQPLRRAILLPVSMGYTDDQLLERFGERQDEIAFEIMVRRHGPMVMGVCRRLLRHQSDADDAFQATFLVLVRKASSISPRSMLGNWLYGVAWKTATKAKTVAAKRGKRELQVTAMPEPEATPELDSWSELRPLLDQELNRLPDKYRAPIILCDLERKTQKEAARQLGWPEGTLSVRLMRARKVLAKRLARHGVMASASSLSLLLAQNASAHVPPTLVGGVVKAAGFIAAGQVATAAISHSVMSLTQGVLKTMLLHKLKFASATILTVALLSSGGGLVARHLSVEQQIDAKKEIGSPSLPKADSPKQTSAASTKPAIVKGDNEKLRGTWKVVSRITKQGESTKKDQRWIIGKDRIILSYGLIGFGAPPSGPQEATYQLWGDNDDAAPAANFINMTLIVVNVSPDGEGTMEQLELFRGIYGWDGERLKLCFRYPSELGLNKRPKVIPTEPIEDPLMFVMVLERDENPTPVADEEKLQGRWDLVKDSTAGEKAPAEQIAEMNELGGFTFEGNLLRFPIHSIPAHQFKLDPTKSPKRFTMRALGHFLTNKNGRMELEFAGIYSLEGDTLKLFYGSNMMGGVSPAPSDFSTEPGPGQVLMEFKRRVDKSN